MNVTKLTLPRVAIALLVIAAMISFSVLHAEPTPAAAASMQSAINSCGGRGTYGFTGFGNSFEGNAFGFPVGIVSTNGTITVDPNGRFTIRQVEVVNGQVVNASDTFQGTVTVNPDDCTFTGTFDALPGTTALVGVLVDNGKQARALLTVPGFQINFLTIMK